VNVVKVSLLGMCFSIVNV